MYKNRERDFDRIGKRYKIISGKYTLSLTVKFEQDIIDKAIELVSNKFDISSEYINIICDENDDLIVYIKGSDDKLHCIDLNSIKYIDNINYPFFRKVLDIPKDIVMKNLYYIMDDKNLIEKLSFDYSIIDKNNCNSIFNGLIMRDKYEMFKLFDEKNRLYHKYTINLNTNTVLKLLSEERDSILELIFTNYYVFINEERDVLNNAIVLYGNREYIKYILKNIKIDIHFLRKMLLLKFYDICIYIIENNDYYRKYIIDKLNIYMKNNYTTGVYSDDLMQNIKSRVGKDISKNEYIYLFRRLRFFI